MVGGLGAVSARTIVLRLNHHPNLFHRLYQTQKKVVQRIKESSAFLRPTERGGAPPTDKPDGRTTVNGQAYVQGKTFELPDGEKEEKERSSCLHHQKRKEAFFFYIVKPTRLHHHYHLRRFACRVNLPDTICGHFTF